MLNYDSRFVCKATALALDEIDAMTDSAKKFALAAHADQMYGEHPYSVHLADVADIAQEFNAPPTVCVAAWLHDTLEDTETSFEELERLFGLEVAELVRAVTNLPGSSRAERHSRTYPALRQAGASAVLLKLCDRLANVRESVTSRPDKLAMYAEEHPTFRSLLHMPGEHAELWSALDELLK